ncbi:MAG: DUF2946 family protein [Proteobacteria bacterium]|nr:DUF2946 family protein [Pseudomonadota bacterium]
MDDIVKQAIAKWPNVPHCYGWLGLDVRGHWYLRDAATQTQGGFDVARGSRLEHAKLIEFIQRNYECDARGCWYFQNGPQRVYVELELAPWVWRLQADGGVLSHTGQAAQVHEMLEDEMGRVYLCADIGLGLVHSLDVGLAAEAVEQGRWSPRPIRAAALAQEFGFVLSPAAVNQLRP